MFHAHKCPVCPVIGPSYTHRTYVHGMTQGMRLHSDIGCVQGMTLGMQIYCQGHPVDIAHIVPGPSYRRSTCVQGGMPLGMGLHCQGFPVEMAHALQVAWPSYRYRICVHGMTPGMHLHS